MDFLANPQLASVNPTQRFWMDHVNSSEGQVGMGGPGGKCPALVSSLLGLNKDLTARNSEEPDANKCLEDVSEPL